MAATATTATAKMTTITDEAQVRDGKCNKKGTNQHRQMFSKRGLGGNGNRGRNMKDGFLVTKLTRRSGFV